MNRSLVILLHGVGSNGQDLAPLGASWRSLLPHSAFESPDAPSPFDHGPGYQWFSVDGVTVANRPARVEASRETFDRILEALIARHGLAGDLERVALVGFSQGAIMALDAVSTGRWSVGAVVSLSGRLASPEPPVAGIRTPILLVHGATDPVIPASETTAAERALSGAGAAVQAQVFPGVGHTITADIAARAGAFLAEALTT